MAEAEVHARRGLDLVAGLPDDASRQRTELELRIALSQTLIATKGYAAPEVGRLLGDARQLCERLADPPETAHVLWGQLLHEIVRGKLADARRLAAEMVALGEARNDPALRATGIRLGGNVCFWRGDFPAARAALERTLGLFDPADAASYAALTGLDDHACSALAYLFRALTCLGYPDQAGARRDAALAQARQTGRPYALANALSHAWFGSWGLRSAAALLPVADELSALSAEHGFLLWQAAGMVARGWCLAALGGAREGIALLRTGIADGRRLTPLQNAFSLTLLADAHGTVGEPEAGLECLARAAHEIAGTRECWAEAEMHRMRGELLAATGAAAAAETSFHTALAVAERQSAKLWQLRAAAALARLWHQQGKREEARLVWRRSMPGSAKASQRRHCARRRFCSTR
jgi:hypothetical protein